LIIAFLKASLQVDKLVGSGTIVVTDLYGKQIKNQAFSMGNNTIDISNLQIDFTWFQQLQNKKKLLRN
jgi:phage-related protein